LDKKKYKFSNGLECYQDELTLEQDIKLTQLFSKIDLQNIADVKIIDLISLISKENIIPDLLRIILLSESGIDESKFMSLKNSELKGVIEDFFTLNPLVKDALGIFRTVAAMTTPSLPSSSSEPNAESTTRDS
jgi:hypothetical protein